MARIAFVVGPDYEDSELRQPYQAVVEAGHEAVIVGRKVGEHLRGKRGKDTTEVDAAAADVRADEFDALVIPGGYSPDKLRTDAGVVAFVRAFVAAGKTVAAVCHGPSLLVEADALRGRTVTSWSSIRTDVKNAGGHWVDREVCEDGNLITSRNPDDLPAFDKALLDHLATAVGG